MSLISESYSRMPTWAAAGGAGGAGGAGRGDRRADIVEKEVIAGSRRLGRVGLEAQFRNCLDFTLGRRIADDDACRFRGLAQFKIPRRVDIAGG